MLLLKGQTIFMNSSKRSSYTIDTTDGQHLLGHVYPLDKTEWVYQQTV